MEQLPLSKSKDGGPFGKYCSDYSNLKLDGPQRRDQMNVHYKDFVKKNAAHLVSTLKPSKTLVQQDPRRRQMISPCRNMPNE